MNAQFTNNVDREELRTLLIGSGYKVDRWGHLQKKYGDGVDAPVREYRIKFQDKSIRIEKRITHTDGSREWMRIGGDYYANIRLDKGWIIVSKVKIKVENETV